MFVIPSKDGKKLSQPNLGDTEGNLASSFNLNTTTNYGRIRTSRSKRVLDGEAFETDNPTADLDPAMAFAWYDFDNDGREELIAWMGVILIASNANLPFALDTTSGSPVYTTTAIGNGDMVVFNEKLYVSTATELFEYDKTTGAWVNITTANSISLGDGVHSLATYGDRIYVPCADAKNIYSMNIAGTMVTTGSYTLKIPVWAGSISWIKAGSNRIWAGTTVLDGSRGIIFEWDGQSENIISKIYYIEARGSCGCAMWNDIPYVLDTEGRLIAFNGSGFSEVTRLPLILNEAVPTRYITPQGNKLIHFNGIIYANDRIFLNIDSQMNVAWTYPGATTYTLLDKIPGGVWEYTKENGLIHLNSPSMTDVDDTDEIDYGWAESTVPGAIFDVTPTSTVYPAMVATYIYGARSWNDITQGSNWGLFIDDITSSFYKSGSLVSAWLESDQVADVFQAIVTKFKRLSASTDRITLKYRTYNSPTIPEIFVTWNSDTEFVYNNASLSPFNDAEVGDEITVTEGIGAGDVAHITSITKAGNNYTVTLDSGIIGVVATNNSQLIIQKFKKLKTISGGGITQLDNAPLPLANKDIQIQIKAVMEWKGDNELYQLMVVNNTDQFAK